MLLGTGKSVPTFVQLSQIETCTGFRAGCVLAAPLGGRPVGMQQGARASRVFDRKLHIKHA